MPRSSAAYTEPRAPSSLCLPSGAQSANTPGWARLLRVVLIAARTRECSLSSMAPIVRSAPPGHSSALVPEYADRRLWIVASDVRTSGSTPRVDRTSARVGAVLRCCLDGDVRRSGALFCPGRGERDRRNGWRFVPQLLHELRAQIGQLGASGLRAPAASSCKHLVARSGLSPPP